MATISEIRRFGTELIIPQRKLTEPLAAPEHLSGKLSRFPEEVYNLTRDSHLFRFLISLAGEAGAGSLKKELLLPRLQQMLDSTHFKDLDLLYGNPLGLPRLNLESYEFDPHGDALTQTEWSEVRAKDADYRARCLTWMRAILHGATVDGIALAAEAALGVECSVFERFRYMENLYSDTPTNVYASWAFEEAGFANAIITAGGTPPINAWTYTLSGSAAAPTISGGVGAYGTHFVSATSTAGGADAVKIQTINKIRINPANPYAFSAYWRRRTGAGASLSSMSLLCYNEADGLLGTVYPLGVIPAVNTPAALGVVNPNSGVASTVWERWGGYVAATTWPAGTVKVLPTMFVYGAGSSVGAIDLDAAQFEQGTEATLFGHGVPGSTYSHNEVVIMPQLPDMTAEEHRRVLRLVDRLRPVDTLPTITPGDRIRVERPAIASAASSSAWNVQRFITGRQNVSWPDVDKQAGFWIIGGQEVEAPTFAWIDRQEVATFISIQSVEASSEKIGFFGREQRELFAHLASVTDGFDIHAASRSYAKASAQLQFSIPWVNRATGTA